MAVKIGHASGSEKGTITGNAGDQTGKEVCTRSWYKHSKGWVLIRCVDAKMRSFIAEAMEKACKNPDIGYDQYENQTLYNNVKDKGFDPSKTTKKVETDCARMVRVCCQYACEKVKNGKTIPDFYTASEASVLKKTGLFTVYTDSKHTTQDAYLLRGDILVTKTKGHTVVILENGSKSGAVVERDPEYDLGERVLRNGYEGDDVKQLQKYLIQLGYSCGSYGADGDFGDATEQAVKKFQKSHGCEVDGVVGPETMKALNEALKDTDESKCNLVQIVGGSCNVRPEPNTDNIPLGVAREYECYDYLGQKSVDGWHKIRFKGKDGWVSGKYSKLVEG